MMKKVLAGLVIVIVLIAGGAYYVLSNLDEIVRSAIETYATEAIGTEVSVGSVAINLREGSAQILDFRIANPEGFSERSMLSFSELAVDLDLGNISQELIGVSRISTQDPFVSYERANGTSNLDIISARLSGGEPQEPASAGSESQMQLMIDSIMIGNIQASVSDTLLPRAVDVRLGDIELADLAGTPAEISQQILGPVLRQLARNAGSAFASMATDLVNEQLQEQMDNLENRASEALEQAEDSLNETLNETVGEDIREGIGNLFGN